MHSSRVVVNSTREQARLHQLLQTLPVQLAKSTLGLGCTSIKTFIMFVYCIRVKDVGLSMCETNSRIHASRMFVYVKNCVTVRENTCLSTKHEFYVQRSKI